MSAQTEYEGDTPEEERPLELGTLDETRARWMWSQFARLDEIKQAKDELDGERKAIYEELIPFLRALRRPIAWLDATGKPRLSRIQEAVDLEVDIDLLEKLAGPEVVTPLFARKIPAAVWRNAVDSGVIPYEIAAQVTKEKPKAPFVAQ